MIQPKKYNRTHKLTMKITKIIAFLLLTACCFLTFSASAAEVVKKNRTPIQIEADHMLSDQKSNSVFFSGKVEAKQDTVIIHADEMTVFYDKGENKEDTGKEQKRDIEKLLASGNVEITKDEWVATGDNAEYFEAERKLIITGNTKVWQNNNLVTGDKFIMYLDEGKSIVERNGQQNERVKAFFYPNSDQK